MPCPVCRSPVREGAEFCTQCGAGLRSRCQACGAALEPTHRFCGACGRAVTEADARGRAPVHPAEAEHRQITVAFCDLVGSTAHASMLDPEDWRDIVREFQKTCIEVIQRFDGHVAQYLGDGLLVYFGYPAGPRRRRRARDPVGARPAGRAHRPQPAPRRREHGLQLAARVGIHTGPGRGRRHGTERAAGDPRDGRDREPGRATPERRAPGSVVISRDTLQIVQGIFVTEDLGAPDAQGCRATGLGAPRPAGERGAQPPRARARTPDARSSAASRRWASCSIAGSARSTVKARPCWCAGAAGIGKSRLMLALRERLSPDPHTWFECRGSLYTQGSSLPSDDRAAGGRPRLRRQRHA